MRAVRACPSRPASGEVLIPMVIDRLGSSTCSGSSGDRVVGVGERLADRDLLEAGDRDDVAGTRGLGRDALQRLGDVHLGELDVLDRAVEPAPRDGLAALQRPRDDPAQGEPTDVGGGVEVAHERLERRALVERGRGDVVDDGLEQLGEVPRGAPCVRRRPALTGARVEDGEGDLVLVGVEVQEELLDLVDDLCRPRVGPVDLVDDEHDGQALSRASCARTNRVWGSGPSAASTRRITASTMASPRSTSPPKSAWPGVSMMLIVRSCQLTAVFLARMVMPFSRSRSPESMTRSVSSSWARERAGLAQHFVHQRGLAVVDVGDDRDVSKGSS